MPRAKRAHAAIAIELIRKTTCLLCQRPLIGHAWDVTGSCPTRGLPIVTDATTWSAGSKSHESTNPNDSREVSQISRYCTPRKTDLAFSKLNTVPFSHIDHEEFHETCRTCHHESMTPCVECHTLAGSEKAQGVTLQRAMHDLNSEHSCVGCHETHKRETSCSGCHSLMEQGRLSDHACTICHSGPSPTEAAAMKYEIDSVKPFRAKPDDTKLSFTDDDIPEQVTIDVLSEKYEAVAFPHRKIVNKLLENINESKIATFFHGNEDVACQGCHHHSPAGQKPPLCENCHGEPFNEAELFKPGLLGAYHRQCIGCHESMQIEPTDCLGCHKEKTTESNPSMIGGSQ